MSPKIPARLSAVSGLALILASIPPRAGAAPAPDANAPVLSGLPDGQDPVLVSAQAWTGYVRTKLPDGSFAPEYYVFGNGGRWKGPMADPTIDSLSFDDVARMLAESLARQRYLPGRDPAKTTLLVMVYWGTTTGPADNRDMFRGKISRGHQNVLNAQMLGVDPMIFSTDQVTVPDMLKIPGFQPTNGVSRLSDNDWRYYYDLRRQVAHNRYFVVLMAYDFQRAWKEKKHRLLWVTRFSIVEARHDFTQDLPGIAKFAEPYFGQNSQGLVVRVPEGRVVIGPFKVLGSLQK